MYRVLLLIACFVILVNDAFELLTDNIAIVSMLCYFDLFCLCFRIQINLWKEKGGPLNQLSSGCDYCLHQSSAPAVPVIRAQRVVETTIPSIDLIGQETEETDTKITITRQEIQELKNRQALTDHLLNNLIGSSHGKLVVTCLAMQSQSKLPKMSVDAISTCLKRCRSLLFN
jgi:hypothetical protein